MHRQVRELSVYGKLLLLNAVLGCLYVLNYGLVLPIGWQAMLSFPLGILGIWQYRLVTRLLRGPR
jgi:hypothetical protein